MEDKELEKVSGGVDNNENKSSILKKYPTPGLSVPIEPKYGVRPRPVKKKIIRNNKIGENKMSDKVNDMNNISEEGLGKISGGTDKKNKLFNYPGFNKNTMLTAYGAPSMTHLLKEQRKKLSESLKKDGEDKKLN